MELNCADESSAEVSAHSSVTVVEVADDDQAITPTKSRLDPLLLSPELLRVSGKYACSVCHESFFSLGQLAKHIQFHDRHRPFPCNTCGKRFLSRSHHDEHQRVHTGERPFPCPRCDRSFTTHHNLKRHQVIHDKEEAYRCTVCGVLFCQDHHLGNLSSIIRVLKQHDIMELESLSELEAKMKLEPNIEENLELKPKKKKQKQNFVSSDKDRCPFGQFSEMPSDSEVPQVDSCSKQEVPEIRNRKGYRIQRIAYDMEVVL